jgi:ATP-dependent DNA helicase RecQ
MSSALDDPVRQAPVSARQVLQVRLPAFRGQQAAIVDHVVAGGDALVLMPTGGGKSLCYQVPAIVRQQPGRASRWWCRR